MKIDTNFPILELEPNIEIGKCSIHGGTYIDIKNSTSKIIKSARNIPNLKIIDQAGANVYDMLKYKNIIFTTSSIKSFQDRITK